MKNLIKKYDPVVKKAEFVFQLLFFIYICLGFNNLTIGTKIIPLFMWPTFLLGAALCCLRLFDWYSFRGIPGLLPLLGLCAVCSVSILYNRQYHMKENLIYLIFWVFYFFLLYASPRRRSPDLLQKRFAFFFHLFCVVAFVLTVISFMMLAVGYCGFFDINGEEVRRGFLGGRLFGAYQTPNAGAVIGALVIVGSIHYAKIYKNKWYTVWAVLNGLLQFVFSVFADSRTGRVTLGVSLGVYFFFVFYGKRRNAETRASGWKTALVAVCAAVIAVGGFFLPKAAELSYNAVARSVQTNGAEGSADEETSAGAKDDVLILGRKESLEGDYSNRRFDFWKSGLEIFAARPVLGVTFRGFLPFAEEYLPDTYLLNNDFQPSSTFDNDVINLMVSNGALGLICFVLFVFFVLFRFFRWLRAQKKQNEPLPPALPMLLAVCAGAATSSMFSSGVFYMHCQYSFLFWLALGICVRFCLPADGEGADPGAKEPQKEDAAHA